MSEGTEEIAVGSEMRLDLAGADPRQPKYELLKDYFMGELQAHRLKPGQSLPTEVELADTFNLARTTVRRALRDLEKEGVVDRIRGKGTFISKSARRGLKRRLSAFALVVHHTAVGHYPVLLQGFEEAANEAHSQVIISSTDNDVVRQGTVILQLLEKEVAGVAIVPADEPATPAYQILPLQRHGIPVVFVHRPVEGIQAPLLSIPFREISHMAGKALLQQGHRRVAIFTGAPSKASQVYIDGLRETMRAGGGDLPEDCVFHGGDDHPEIKEREKARQKTLERILSGPDRPTGIVTTYDTEAELLYVALGQMGLHMPEDISVISFGGKNRQGAILRQFTSVVIDGAWVGRRAGELLQEMQDGRRPLDDNEEIVIPISMAEGRTLGPPLQAVLSFS
jgi:DNA-binding LacI/PurR family transcriptional regulator